MLRFLALLWLFCTSLCSLAQPTLTEVKGLPTNEVFDLMVDRKGFLWVGHDMGVSRYDGVSFTHFAHPKRSSLSITDLVEDRFGRVWFHNFTGQVFYIENDQIQLLQSYNNEAENFFPRMVLCNDELVVTSRKGVFVCDTRTLQGRYHFADEGKDAGILSLSGVGDKVLALGKNKWYLYRKGTGIQSVDLSSEMPHILNGQAYTLQPQSFNDTAFLIINPTGNLLKLIVKNGRVAVGGSTHVNGYINSVAPDRNTLWLHLKNYSMPIAGVSGTSNLSGYNISDVVTDLQGNKWYSSLGKGLLVEPAGGNISPIVFTFLKRGETVSTMRRWADKCLIGTQEGNLYYANINNKKLIWTSRFQKGMGSVTYISPSQDSVVLVSTSSASYLFNRATNTLIPFLNSIIKGSFITPQYAIVASSAGLFLLPPAGLSTNASLLKEVDLETWTRTLYASRKSQSPVTSTVLYRHRARTLAPVGDNELFVSFMNGVFRIGPDKAEPLLVNGEKVYSNSMVAYGNTLFIGTLNAGLLMRKGAEYRHISTEEGLFSNSIIRLKQEGKYLWILQDKAIQLFDLTAESLVNGIELPQETGANVYDVTTVGDTAYVSTKNGIYQVVLRPSAAYKTLKSYLQAVLINNSGNRAHSGAVLRYNQNNIQFNLSIPYYSPSNSVYFKYRLKDEKGSAGNEHWFATQQGERIIRFASLTPGSYTFEAFAVVAGSQEMQPVMFHFTINKPWWKTTEFMLLTIGIVALMFYALYRYRIRQVLKVEQVRRAISSDLHDEIGSTLSSINIYSEIARSEAENREYLNLIQENTREVIGKLDDLVWSINPKNDSVQQLVSRMRSFAEPVLEGAGIQCRFSANDDLINQELPLITKRNLYLIFKELVNNVVKHARAKNCLIEFSYANSKILLSVSDDGIGMPANKGAKGRSGMQNMLDRSNQLHATIYFQENSGGGTIVKVTVPVK